MHITRKEEEGEGNQTCVVGRWRLCEEDEENISSAVKFRMGNWIMTGFWLWVMDEMVRCGVDD